MDDSNTAQPHKRFFLPRLRLPISTHPSFRSRIETTPLVTVSITIVMNRKNDIITEVTMTADHTEMTSHIFLSFYVV